MDFKKEIINERNEKLGLNNVDTELVFNTLLKTYKELLLNAPKSIMDYTLDIVIANANGYNRLGSLEDLYTNYGDKFFIDLNNSCFVADEVDEDGSCEGTDSISFNKLESLNKISKYSISLKELIKICKLGNYKIGLFSDSKENDPFTIEINIQKAYNPENKSIKSYIGSLKK